MSKTLSKNITIKSVQKQYQNVFAIFEGKQKNKLSSLVLLLKTLDIWRVKQYNAQDKPDSCESPARKKTIGHTSPFHRAHWWTWAALWMTELLPNLKYKNLIFGSVRSSRSHNVSSSVRLVQTCQELSIFIFLRSQVSLNSVSGQSQVSLRLFSG